MSKLLITDNGRVLKDHNEDLTRWRWAKKVLRLTGGAAKADADLWIMASAYEGAKTPLQVKVNGKSAGVIKPSKDAGLYRWHQMNLPARLLRQGDNEIIFQCDTPVMNAWRLALDNTTGPGNSFISFDRGKSWRNDRMGVYNVLAGEYVVRLRSKSSSLHDAAPPDVVYSNPKHPKLRELRDMLPKSITSQSDPWRQILALRTWVATRWSHDPFGPPYSPWDGPTILDWAKHDRGHSGKGKVAMCVHFAVVFSTFATALGHKTRCVTITPAVNTPNGHFVAEVYDRKRRKWILHDTNYDAHYEDDVPLSAVEISQRVNDGMKGFPKLVRAGRGMPTRPARVIRGFKQHFASGISYRHIAVWQRMDFITDPAQAAAHHGSISYNEPEWVWFTLEGTNPDNALGMFPWHAPGDWFTKSS